MYKVLLFYQYCDIKDPYLMILWQRELCSRLNLVGRVIISEEGINGTLCGIVEQCNTYQKLLKEYALFKNIDFKRSNSNFVCFDSLKIKYKKEIVILNEDIEKINYKESALKISPDQFHTLLENKEEDLIIFDTRNTYESRIGKFKDAICPNITNSREFKKYFQNNENLFKNKNIAMYCTGGVRCERVSVLLKKTIPIKNIVHLENGIHGYVEKYPNGFFRGRNYVFDDRVSIKINEDILTHCDICSISCDLYNNCLNAICNKQYICCDICFVNQYACCSKECITLTQENKVPKRPPLKSRIKIN